jgi:hypothetical protein
MVKAYAAFVTTNAVMEIAASNAGRFRGLNTFIVTSRKLL